MQCPKKLKNLVGKIQGKTSTVKPEEATKAVWLDIANQAKTAVKSAATSTMSHANTAAQSIKSKVTKNGNTPWVNR